MPLTSTWIGLLVWIGGVLSLFKLDFFEAAIVIIINWGLNLVINWFLFAAIARAMLGGG